MVRPQSPTDTRLPQACETIPVALTDVDKLTTIVSESNAVIYCAGSVRGRNSADFAYANIHGVRSMLEALERSGSAASMLLLSSLAASQPQLSDYALSKHEGEHVLLARPSLPWTVLRPPAVYGPGDREMLPILKMIRKGLLVQIGPPDQRLSLLHVDDLVNAILAWLSAPQKCRHKIYSIDDGTSGGYTWQAISEAVSRRKVLKLMLPRFLLETTARANLGVSRLLGYAPMLTPGKVRELLHPQWLCDNSEFSSDTGWTPGLDLKQGVQQLFMN